MCVLHNDSHIVYLLLYVVRLVCEFLFFLLSLSLDEQINLHMPNLGAPVSP